MKKSKSPTLVLRWLPACAMACAALLVYHFRASLTPQALLALSPRSAAGAVGFLVGLYLLKSLSIVLPVWALYLLGGLLFHPAGAIAANLLGVAAGLSLSYWLGRLSGGPLAEAIAEKHPKAAQIDLFLRENAWFCAFVLRLVGVLPLDVVSLYLGANELPFVPYLLGGMAGMLPGVIMVTLMGTSLSDPTSPSFWLSAACSVTLSALSVLWYRAYRKKKGP